VGSATAHIDYDTTPIQSAQVRRSVDVTLDRLSLRKRDDVWQSLSRPHGGFPSSTTVVVADLHQLSGSEQLEYWSAGPSNMAYVFLVRTDSDRRRLRDPEYALRLNDEKFFLLYIEGSSTHGVDFFHTLQNYFRLLVDILGPDRVRSARFAEADSLLWVEFGDGLERGVRWETLPFAARLDFTPVSASAAEHGQSILFLDSHGRELDVDAGALRAVVDSTHGQRIKLQDASERKAAGERFRQVRERSGLSQEELAMRSGIPQESLSRFENGRRDPRMETLRKLAAGYGLEIGDFLARLGE
jgi:DNA-binding XRE family transcriptional regulator